MTTVNEQAVRYEVGDLVIVRVGSSEMRGRIVDPRRDAAERLKLVRVEVFPEDTPESITFDVPLFAVRLADDAAAGRAEVAAPPRTKPPAPAASAR